MRPTVLLILGSGCWLWLWFMVKRPGKWGAVVDQENAFWVNSRVISASFGEACKRIEKGPAQRYLVFAAAILSSAGSVLTMVWK